MEQETQTLTISQTTQAGTFSVKIENTTYVVGIHFSQIAKDTLEDKTKYLMLNEVKFANF